MEYRVKTNPSFYRMDSEWSKDIGPYNHTIASISLDYSRAKMLGTIIGNAYFAGDSRVRKYLDEDLKIGVDWEEGFMVEDFYAMLTRRFNELSLGFNTEDRRLYACARGFENFKIYDYYRIDRLAPIEIFDYLSNDDLELYALDGDDDIDKEKYQEFNSMTAEARAFEHLNDVEFMNLSIVYSKYGWCYLHGYGCEKNPSKAFDYYTKASDMGNVDAMTVLGKMHLKGVGTKRDYGKALCQLTEAAIDGSIKAINQLVDMYLSKSYGCYNQALAIACMKAGNKKKSEYCQLKLGEAYYYGLGVAKDENKARYIWVCMEDQEPEGYKEYVYFKYLRRYQYIDEDYEEMDEDDAYELEQYAKHKCYSGILNELYLYYLDKNNELAMKYKEMYEKRLEEEKYEIDD